MSDILSSPSKKVKHNTDHLDNNTSSPVAVMTSSSNNNYPNSPLFDFDSHSPGYYNTQNTSSLPATPISQLPFSSQVPNSREWSPSIKISSNMPDNFSFPDTMSPSLSSLLGGGQIGIGSKSKSNSYHNDNKSNKLYLDGIASSSSSHYEDHELNGNNNNTDENSLVQQLIINKKILSDRIRNSNNGINDINKSNSNKLEKDPNNNKTFINSVYHEISSTSLLTSTSTTTDQGNNNRDVDNHSNLVLDYDSYSHADHSHLVVDTPKGISKPYQFMPQPVVATDTNKITNRSALVKNSRKQSVSRSNTMNTSSDQEEDSTGIISSNASTIIDKVDDLIDDIPPNSPMPGLAAITAAAEALPLPVYHNLLIGSHSPLHNHHLSPKKTKSNKYNTSITSSVGGDGMIPIPTTILLGEDNQPIDLEASYSANMEKFLSSKNSSNISSSLINTLDTSNNNSINAVSSLMNNKLIGISNNSSLIYGTPNISTIPLSSGTNLLSENRPSYVICNCKRSRCLKMYCDCFRFTLFCKEACRCNDCANGEFQSIDKQEERKLAISAIVERNPEAFKPRVTEDVYSNSKGHLTGCHCRRSACLKKYCECYTGGVPCADRCRCIECKNIPEMYSAAIRQAFMSANLDGEMNERSIGSNKLSDTESEAAEVLYNVLHSPPISRAVSLTGTYRDPATNDTEYSSHHQNNNHSNLYNFLHTNNNTNGTNNSNETYHSNQLQPHSYMNNQTGLTELKQQLHIDSDAQNIELLEHANLFISPDHSNFNSPIKPSLHHSSSSALPIINELIPRSPMQSLLDLAGICEQRGVEEELQKSSKK